MHGAMRAGVLRSSCQRQVAVRRGPAGRRHDDLRQPFVRPRRGIEAELERVRGQGRHAHRHGDGMSAAPLLCGHALAEVAHELRHDGDGLLSGREAVRLAHPVELQAVWRVARERLFKVG